MPVFSKRTAVFCSDGLLRIELPANDRSSILLPAVSLSDDDGIPPFLWFAKCAMAIHGTVTLAQCLEALAPWSRELGLSTASAHPVPSTPSGVSLVVTPEWEVNSSSYGQHPQRSIASKWHIGVRQPKLREPADVDDFPVAQLLSMRLVLSQKGWLSEAVADDCLPLIDPASYEVQSPLPWGGMGSLKITSPRPTLLDFVSDIIPMVVRDREKVAGPTG